jgi:hypothetical protein
VDLGRLGVQPDVVPVEGDVEGTDRHGGAFDAFDLPGQAKREVVAPGGDPDQRQAAGSLVPLQDLVGDAGDHPADLGGLQEASPFDEGAHRPHPKPSPAARKEETPRGGRGACACCNSLASLPGLTGPDLKGKYSSRFRIAAGGAVSTR